MEALRCLKPTACFCFCGLVALAIFVAPFVLMGCSGGSVEYAPDPTESLGWEETCLALHQEEKLVLYDVVDSGPVEGNFDHATNLLNTYDIVNICWDDDEVIYEFSPIRSGYYRITLRPEFNGGLFVLRADCRTSPYTLNFSDWQDVGGEELVVSFLNWGETYFIVVEETAPGSSLNFTISLEYEHGICHGDNPCGEDEECIAGRCQIADEFCEDKSECDDNDWCTYDQCGSDGRCYHDIRGDCLGGVSCVDDKDCAHLTDNDCITATCGTQWTKDDRCHLNKAPDGWLCDDGWDWTHGDHCQNGVCVFEVFDAS